MNLFPLSNQGSQAPKFIYEKYGNIYFEMRSTSRFASPLGRRNIASLLNPLNLFMGITSCLLPSSSCLLKQTAAITEAITTLQDAENLFGFIRVEDEQFFPEWYEGLSEITEAEKASVDVVRRRYLYHRAGGDLLEGTVILLLVSPILALSGFYDPPFRIKAESSVELVLNDGQEILRGRIDVLVLQNQFWVMVLESKKTTLSVWSAVPQALADMIANPNPSKPIFGMVTNGDDILFVKVTQTNTPHYDLSKVFTPFASVRELYAVLQILKRIGQLISLVS
jgi:hypothetical protein